jgi:phasin family protein
MFEQFNETMKDAMKPVTDLATLNMSTMQDLAEKQNTLLSTLLSDGMAFVEKASQQKDVMSLAEAQKAYFEGFQETLTDAAKTNYSILSEAQQKAGEMMKVMSEDMTSKFTTAK